jgi:hypothetical protein
LMQPPLLLQFYHTTNPVKSSYHRATVSTVAICRPKNQRQAAPAWRWRKKR